MSNRFDVVVVGAGVTGLSVATLLAQSPHAADLRIRVVDAAERPVWQADKDVALRVSAISCGSADLLEDVGAWSAIESSRLCPYDHMSVWDAADEPTSASSLQFDADEFAVQHLGYIVENVLIQHALLGVLDAAEVEIGFDAPIASIDADAPKHRVVLQSGAVLDADLIVGADGARSVVRESAGIQVQRRPYAHQH